MAILDRMTTMKTKTTSWNLWTGALVAAGILALSGCQRTTTLDTRSFTLKHLTPNAAEQIVAPYVFRDREGAPGTMSATSGVLTVRETADNLEKIQRVLDQYDVPQPDVRLRFQLIEADGFTDTDSAIAPVEAQLRKIFQFRGYHLLGEAVVGATDGSDMRQRLPGGYVLDAQVYRTDPGTVRVQEIKLYAPGLGTVLQTTVNVRLGQTLVVGTASKGSNSTATLLLTVRAEAATDEN
jgi:hypothetical protein